EDGGQPMAPEQARRGVALCDMALEFAESKGPWRALRGRFESRLVPREPTRRRATPDDPPEAEGPALGWFQWGLLRDLEGRRESAIAWLKRSTQLAPKNYWSQCYLAGQLDLAGRYDLALVPYGAAVALNPELAWAHFNRARLYQQRNDWDWAL